jgi:hypothetical protein
MQMMKLSEGTAARRRIFFTMVDSTDLHTRETGVTVTVRVSKNGAADAAAGGSAVEVDTSFPGLYYYEATSGELDTVGIFCIYCTGTGCEPREVAVQIVAFDPYDASLLGLTGVATAAALATVDDFVDTEIADIQARLPAALIDGKIAATDALVSGTASAGAAQTITLAGASTTAGLYNGTIVAITSGTGAGQSRRIVDYTTGRVATVHRAWTTNPDGTSKFIVCPDTGHLETTALVASDAGNTASTFKTDLTESTNDHWVDVFVVFITGSLLGQCHKVTDYNGTTKFLTFTSPGVFTAAPSAGDRFLIINR